MSPRYRVFTNVCYSLTVFAVILLFAENFIFSSHMGYLGFREVDDIAFQSSIRQVHLNMVKGNIANLLVINDYAYGWIFWFSMSLVTFPFFLLSHYFQIDWPLIVLPRQISLLFAVLCLFTLSKILKRFAVPQWGISGVLLIFILLPFTGYFSMRFGTVNAVMFFSMLSLYLAMRDQPLDYVELVKIVICLAVAGAIKLTGLMITPLVLFYVYMRLRDQYRGRPLPSWVFKSVVLFCLIGILMAAPQLPYVIFKPDRLLSYLHNLQHFIEVTRIPSGSQNPWQRLFEGAFGTVGVAVAYALMGCGLLMGCILEKPRRLEFIAMTLALILVGVYLAITVKNALSIGSYFTCISFVFLIGLVPLLKKRWSIWLLILLVGILLLDAINRSIGEFDEKSSTWNHTSYFAKKLLATPKLELAEKTLACINSHQSATQVKHIFLDYSAPSLINSLSWPHACVSLAWNNLDYQHKYCDTPVDFIVLDRHAVGYLSDEDFKKRVNMTNQTTAEGFQRDKASRISLESSGSFGAQNFRLVCDLGDIRIFKAEK
jgi:hypothetical protein